VLLAHDAAQVAVVGVGVEGDPPGTVLGGGRPAAALAQDAGAQPLDVASVVRHVRHVAAVAEEVAARAEAPSVFRGSRQPSHRLGEALGVAVAEGQPVDFVADELGHTADVRGDDRHARLLRLVDDEWRVLLPYGRHDDRVHPVEDRRHDLLVAVLGEPLNAVRGAVQQPARPVRQSVRVGSARPAPDAQARRARHLGEGLEQHVDALRGDVRSDVAENEVLSQGRARAPRAGRC
jgi:hypothetical protein